MRNLIKVAKNSMSLWPNSNCHLVGGSRQVRPNVNAANSPARKAAMTFHPSVLTNSSTISETAGPNLPLLPRPLKDREIQSSKQVARLGAKISGCLNGPFNFGTSL